MRRTGIHFNSEVVIKDEYIEYFRTHMAKTLAAVKATEPDTIEYIAYISRDGKRCQVDQWFADAAALRFHLRGEAAKLNDELFIIADFYRLWLYTDIDDPEINELFDSLHVGDKILMGPVFGGYDRTLGFEVVPVETPDS